MISYNKRKQIMSCNHSINDYIQNKTKVNKMANIREMAHEVVEKVTKNIADLEKIDCNIDVVEKERTREDGSSFKINVFEVDGEEYKMPYTVLVQLKAILQVKPELEFFKVVKTGEGLKTKYQVVSL